ncbi:alpha-ketoacid dehydrogenase subunit beta [Candidatus Woesearchaeota archaeon]|nr:alpha-ketoacid dehydrogenase subunit beta [Candidatus Woesearchaeota archaeon]
MAKINIVEAVNSALAQEMEKDNDVIVMGEDVGVNGGVFRATDNLQKKFGPNRVIDTPLSEEGIVGTAIGMAAYGLKPVAEIQFSGFLFAAFDQLFSHAARIRWRSSNRYHVPLVVRTPGGGGVRAFELHCECPESYFAHMPGIKVVCPSTPYDTKGLLISAIRDPDPVIFLEPMRIYRAIKEEVPEKEYTIPLGKAKIAREGNDVTLVTYGAMAKYVLQAAEKIQDKVDAEVIDLRTIYPFDSEAIINSVKKTGRAVIVHEAPKTSGFGAEIIATINEKALLSLEAPIVRVTGYDTVLPMAKLENYHIPSEERIIKGISKVMSF